VGVKDIQVDGNGVQHCWKCGGTNFTRKRTTRSKVAFGFGALLANQKLRCDGCGEYNDTGSAKPYYGSDDFDPTQTPIAVRANPERKLPERSDRADLDTSMKTSAAEDRRIAQLRVESSELMDEAMNMISKEHLDTHTTLEAARLSSRSCDLDVEIGQYDLAKAKSAGDRTHIDIFAKALQSRLDNQAKARSVLEGIEQRSG
jgi:hypothetical protein